MKKTKTKTKKASLDYKPVKPSKYNYTEITQMSQAKKSEFKWLEFPHSE